VKFDYLLLLITLHPFLVSIPPACLPCLVLCLFWCLSSVSLPDVMVKRTHLLVLIALGSCVLVLMPCLQGYIGTATDSRTADHHPSLDAGDAMTHPVTARPGTETAVAFKEVVQVIPDTAHIDPTLLRVTQAHRRSNIHLTAFLQSLQPTVYCTTAERTCYGLDGGKWLCHPRVLLNFPGEPCVVYSAGSRGNFRFEKELLKLAPHCEIHVFDPTPGLALHNLPTAIHFHSEYGLAGPQVKAKDINGSMVPMKTLEEVMGELGHDRLKVLKLDIERSELDPGFVNTEANSPWRRVTLLQVEIHAGKLESTVGLVRDLEQVGFSLYQVEPNYRHPRLGEFSFLNLDLMAPYLQIPYTATQVAKLRKASLERAAMGSKKADKNSLLGVFSQVEQSHYGCAFARRIPGQVSRVYCEAFLRQPGLDESLPVVYIFDDGVGASATPWAKALAAHLPVEVHLWTGDSSGLAESGPGLRVHAMAGIATAGLLADGIPSLMKDLGHAEVSMVVLSLTNVVDQVNQALAEDEQGNLLLMARDKFSQRRFQLVLDVSLCATAGGNQERLEQQMVKGVDRALASLERAGMSLLGKFINIERISQYPEDRSLKGNLCDLTLTYAF